MPLIFRDHLKRDGWIPKPESSFHGNQAIADAITHIGFNNRPLKKSVQELKNLIENDPDLYMGFTDMFKEAGRGSLVRDYKKMIELINEVVSQPPIFRDFRGGAPGLSFNNILGSVIVTPSGFNAFCNDALNLAFQKILAEWYEYFEKPESAQDRPLPHPDSKDHDFIISPADSRIYGIATNVSC